MQFCRDCSTKTVGVLSFSKYKNEKFNRYPKCYSETKHKKFDDKELSFGEVLDKEIHKRKIIHGR